MRRLSILQPQTRIFYVYVLTSLDAAYVYHTNPSHFFAI
jgi:hypothetical protein